MNGTAGRKLSWAPPVLYTKEWVEKKRKEKKRKKETFFNKFNTQCTG